MVYIRCGPNAAHRGSPHDGSEDRFATLAALVCAFIVLAGLAAVLHGSGGKQGKKAGNFFGGSDRTQGEDRVDEFEAWVQVGESLMAELEKMV